MPHTLYESVWAGPLLWMTLHLSDCYLTFAGARLYRLQDKIVFQGSYELNPYFEADVNALRAFSPRFWAAFVLSTAWLLVVRGLAVHVLESVALYVAILGAMVLLQLAVHVRHFRNVFLLSKGPAVMEGRVQYPADFLLHASAFEFLVFAALYSALFLATDSLFILGGALGCAVIAVNQYVLSRRGREPSPQQ